MRIDAAQSLLDGILAACMSLCAGLDHLDDNGCPDMDSADMHHYTGNRFLQQSICIAGDSGGGTQCQLG